MPPPPPAPEHPPSAIIQRQRRVALGLGILAVVLGVSAIGAIYRSPRLHLRCQALCPNGQTYFQGQYSDSRAMVQKLKEDLQAAGCTYRVERFSWKGRPSASELPDCLITDATGVEIDSVSTAQGS